MDQLFLQVWVYTQNSIDEILSECPDVEKVRLTFHRVEDRADFPVFGEEFDHVVVTDDAAVAASYADVRGVDVIFIGKSADVCPDDKVPANLKDVWHPDDSAAFMLGRFRSIVRDLKSIYHAWLYETYLMATIDTMQDLVWYKDKPGLHWLVNNKFENTVHKTRDMIYGMGHNYIWDVPPEDGGKAEFRCLESEREVFEKEETCVADEQVKTDAGLRHFLTYKSPLFGRDGNAMGTVGIGHDVTDFNNASLELKILLDNLPFVMPIGKRSISIAFLKKPLAFPKKLLTILIIRYGNQKL